jgi:hypothetical protein
MGAGLVLETSRPAAGGGVMPIRIQRKRSKGWRMPENTVYVGRGSRWGNPFRVGVDGTAAECVQKYADHMLPYRHHGEHSGLESFFLSSAILDDIISELRGKNVACWCKLGEPCHADFLLEMANSGETK